MPIPEVDAPARPCNVRLSTATVRAACGTSPRSLGSRWSHQRSTGRTSPSSSGSSARARSGSRGGLVATSGSAVPGVVPPNATAPSIRPARLSDVTRTSHVVAFQHVAGRLTRLCCGGTPHEAGVRHLPTLERGDSAPSAGATPRSRPCPAALLSVSCDKPVGLLAIGPRYPGVLSDDGLTVLFTHPGDAQWTEVVPLEDLAEAPEAPNPRRRGK